MYDSQTFFQTSFSKFFNKDGGHLQAAEDLLRLCNYAIRRLSNLQEQFREKDDQLQEKEGINLHLQTLLNTKNQQLEEKIRQEENLYQKLRVVEEQISQSQAQLREKELEKAKLLKKRDRQNGNLRAIVSR